LRLKVMAHLFVIWNQKVYCICQKFPTFKQSEVPSPCSQEPTTKPCPDLDNSTPRHPLCLLRLILVLSSHVCVGLSSDFSLSGILTKYSLIYPTHAT
jgi:hypothetical protein